MSMNFVTFNQDYSHLAVGTSRGFRIFTTDPFVKCYETREGNITLLEMLFSTSLVALILSPRRLQIKNTKACSTTETGWDLVLAIRLNRRRLVIILEDQIYLYDIQNMKLLETIATSPNPMAICALSPSSAEDSCYLAYPLPQKSGDSQFSAPTHIPPNSSHVPTTSGEVLLFDTIRLEAVNVIEAHKSPLSCIQFNNDGKLLATASDKGTIIRVFAVPDGQKLYQFRRGSMPSRIFSMAFNITSTLLCVSSASETVHVFKLMVQQLPPSDDLPSSPIRSSPAAKRLSRNSAILGDGADVESGADESEPFANRKTNGTFMGLLRRTSQSMGSGLATTVGSYLPKGVAEIWEPARDFAWIRIPRSTAGASQGQMRSVVAMSSNSPQVMVVTNEGSFYAFNVDLAKGGEGNLIKQYSILDINDRPGASAADS